MDARFRVIPVPAPDESKATASLQLFMELKQASRAPVEVEPDREPLVVNAVNAVLDDVDSALQVSQIAYELQTLVNAVTPALCTAVGAWLGSRNGRKVRIKVGDIEAEAQTREDVEKLLERARGIQQEIQERNQPPKVALP
jgi:hypothetical protein